MKYFNEQSFCTDGFWTNALVTPFVSDDGIVGYRFQREGSTDVRFVYLNPSRAGDGGYPDVFVYIGENIDPADGAPQVFVSVFDQEA